MTNIIHKWILENLSQTPTIIEAGVCDGLDTEFFAKSFPNGKIYGFPFTSTNILLELGERSAQAPGNWLLSAYQNIF